MTTRARPLTLDQQLRQVRNRVAATGVAQASDGAAQAEVIEAINDSIDGGGAEWPLATTAQTLSGAINEIVGRLAGIDAAIAALDARVDALEAP
jgi:hypothetical protein